MVRYMYFHLTGLSNHFSRLLLEYGYGPHVLVLSASGTGDVNELRTHLKDNICYAIFREQTQDNKPLCISINYIPNSVRGVWRGGFQRNI